MRRICGHVGITELDLLVAPIALPKAWDAENDSLAAFREPEAHQACLHRFDS